MTETKIMTTCGGVIGLNGTCNKCGQNAMTTSSYCNRLIEVPQNEIKAMSEAEKKWEEQDLNSSMKLSREAYKAALRREIEKRIEILESHISEHEVGDDDWLSLTSRVNELRKTIQLLDTVEP